MPQSCLARQADFQEAAEPFAPHDDGDGALFIEGRHANAEDSQALITPLPRHACAAHSMRRGRPRAARHEDFSPPRDAMPAEGAATGAVADYYSLRSANAEGDYAKEARPGLKR